MEKKAIPNVSKPIAPPAGLQAIINQCLKIYPDQPNPLQVTTVVKYWLVPIHSSFVINVLCLFYLFIFFNQ